RLFNQLPDGHRRVEGSEGILKHHLQIPAHPAQGPSGKMGDVPPFEQDLAVRRFQQPQNRAAGGGLSAAGLPDEAEGFPLLHRKAHLVDGLDITDHPAQHPAPDRKILGEIFHFQHGFAHPSSPSPVSCRKQRTRCPGAISISSGSARRHFSQAFSQRGANLHPLGHSSGDGTFPRMEYKRFCSSSRLGTDLRSPSVYGCAGCSNRRKTSASSTTRPAYITTTRSAISATTPKSWVISRIAVSNFSFTSRISSKICAWMVTSRAVVGSSAINNLGLHATAMAIIARWRMPPDNWCGYS